MSFAVAVAALAPILSGAKLDTSSEPPRTAAFGPNRLMTVSRNALFPAGRAQKVYTNIRPGFKFNTIIPSWNLGSTAKGGTPESGAIRVEVRIDTPAGKRSKWFTFGTWSLEGDWASRESVKGQKDASGNVFTDTLKTAAPASVADVRVTLITRPGTQPPKLKHLSLAFSDTTAGMQAKETDRDAWGKTIDVPQRAQGNYPNGGVLCSATSTSMLLWHYSRVLDRPALDHDVPEVEKHVWDPVFKGAGNWPFNTAYVGSFDGLLGYVSRFDSIADLETLIAAGIPVACSVSFDMLRGRPLSPTESGHLVLLVGFTEDGTPVLNDPAFKDGVRKTYPRSDFVKAWNYSDRTVYIDVPEEQKMPRDPKGLWTLSK